MRWQATVTLSRLSGVLGISVAWAATMLLTLLGPEEAARPGAMLGAFLLGMMLAFVLDTGPRRRA